MKSTNKIICDFKDRLLNERAASIALSIIGDCVDLNGWINNDHDDDDDDTDSLCYQLRTAQHSPSKLKSIRFN